MLSTRLLLIFKRKKNHQSYSKSRLSCTCCSERFAEKKRKQIAVNGETYTARGSVKTSVWMCIIRSPPAVYSMTKHTCSAVWKQANKLTRKGWCDRFTTSKMRFSHMRLKKGAQEKEWPGERRRRRRRMEKRLKQRLAHKNIIHSLFWLMKPAVTEQIITDNEGL